MVLQKHSRKWIAAAYFPNGEKRFAQVQKKFVADLAGVAANHAEGFVFVTNQPLSLTEREGLKDLAGDTPCEIYHLENLRVILDSILGVAIRQRYLGISASGEDIVAAIGQLTQTSQPPSVQGPIVVSVDQRRHLIVEPVGTTELSFADLARLALEQGKPEMHRAYVIDQNLLPAFSNPSQPVLPIIALKNFPTDISDCYQLAHETAMLLFFLQRCVALAHMELLSHPERMQLALVIERLWRCTIRLRPLIDKCQPTLLMVGANRFTSPCAHMAIYMAASHFLQEIVQASEQTGYTTAAQALSQGSADDPLPYNPDQIVAHWPDVVLSLRSNWTIDQGFRLLSEAFNDLAAEAVRAARYENGLPIVPAWMMLQRPPDAGEINPHSTA